MQEKFNFKEMMINGVPHNVYSEVEIRPVFGLWTVEIKENGEHFRRASREADDRFEIVEVCKIEETGEEIDRRAIRTVDTYPEARQEAINLVVDWYCAEQGVG